MTDTWAAKVLEGVPRLSAFQTRDVADRATDLTDRKWLRYDDALAAIAKLDAGDGLVERATAALEGVTPGKSVQFHPSYCEEAKGAPFSEWDSSHDLSVILPDGKRYRIGSFRHAADAGFYHFTRQWVPEAAARIAALTAQVAELEVKLGGALLGQWIYAGMPNDPAEAEAATLRAKLARIASAWPIVRDADCSGGTLASAMDEIEAAISDGAADGGKHE